DVSFHPDLVLLGQCGRELFRHPHPPALAARCLPLAGRPASRDQPLSRRAQPQTQTLRLDRRSQPHHRKAKPRVSSVGVKPLGPITGDTPVLIIIYSYFYTILLEGIIPMRTPDDGLRLVWDPRSRCMVPEGKRLPP